MSRKGHSDERLNAARTEMESLMRAYAWLCEDRTEHRSVTFYVNRDDQLKIKLAREGVAVHILKDRL